MTPSALEGALGLRGEGWRDMVGLRGEGWRDMVRVGRGMEGHGEGWGEGWRDMVRSGERDGGTW